MDADVIVVGGGLAGLVAACEVIDAGKRVILLDQEGEQSLGGQAFWSFGGLMFVDSPEQRRMRIRDSHDLALQDWMGTAGFDRAEDHWPKKWAEAYVAFAAGEKRSWLHGLGVRWFPIVGWAERGGYLATEHGNSVPRFHVTWGTGPAIIAPFVKRLQEAAKSGRASLRFRHRVNELTASGGVVDGVAGDVLEPSRVERGVRSSRTVAGDFALKAQAVVVTSGGIGANHDLVRRSWPKRLGEPPKHMLCGVPDHVDGRMLEIVERAGGRIINPDRMWHYTEGITNFAPIWTAHGIRILPGPSSLWIDATGKRLPVPLFPGFDTLGTLAHLRTTGHDYSWFILTQKIIEREFALSGSEQNPDLTGKSILQGARPPLRRARPGRCLQEAGRRFHRQADPARAGRGHERAGGVGADRCRRPAARSGSARPRDRQHLHQGRAGDGHPRRAQLSRRQADPRGDAASPARSQGRAADRGAAVGADAGRRWAGWRRISPVACSRPAASPLGNVFAAGEVAGFGGGGMHGYRALEGTFLGGCLFSGRVAGRAAAKAS